MKGLIITGGKIPQKVEIERFIEDTIYVVAADSGYDNALELGIIPDCLVGDLDSIRHKPAENIQIITFPVDKDFTDAELAAIHLYEKGITEYTLIGGGEGRLDHVISLLDCYSGKFYPDIWITEKEIIYAVTRKLQLELVHVHIISLFNPCSRKAVVSTKGLFWELAKKEIKRGNSSISNRNNNKQISVVVENGALILVSIQLKRETKTFIM